MEQTNNKQFCVYMHTNIANNKRYIGITSQRLERRWRGGKGYPHNTHFNNAINKYGWEEGFKHEVLANGLTEKEAKDMEMKLIAYYKTNDPAYGYNLTEGGDTVNYDTCCRSVCQFDLSGNFLREFKSVTDAAQFVHGQMGHIREVCIGKYATAYKSGWAYSEDCVDREKFKESYMERIQHMNDRIDETHKKPVYQLDDDKNIIARHKSAFHASQSAGFKSQAAVASACANHRYCGGYYWVYVEDYDEYLKNKDNWFYPPMLNQPVAQFDLNGNFVKEYANRIETAKAMNRTPTAISYSCMGKTKSCNGYQFRYIQDCEKSLDGTYKIA